MTQDLALRLRKHVDAKAGPLVVVQLWRGWLDRSSAPGRMAVERVFAERALTGAIEHPVLRFIPHAIEPSPSTPIGDDPQVALLEWLRIIAAWKLLAEPRQAARVSIHRVISDHLGLPDGIYAGSEGGPFPEFELAKQVSSEMAGVTRLIPREFAAYVRRDDDATTL